MLMIHLAWTVTGTYHVEIQPRRDNPGRLTNLWPSKAVVVHGAGKPEPVTAEIDRTNGEFLVFGAVAGYTYCVDPR